MHLCLQSNLHPLARTDGILDPRNKLICALLTFPDVEQTEMILVVLFLLLVVHSQPTQLQLVQTRFKKKRMCSSQWLCCQALGRRQTMPA